VLRVAAIFSDRSSLPTRSSNEKNSETCEAGGGAIHAATMDAVQMALFSRSFIRKRAIAAATTLAVSVAIAGARTCAARASPSPACDGCTGFRPAGVSGDAARAAGRIRAASKAEWKPTPICDRRVHTFEATETSPPSPSPG